MSRRTRRSGLEAAAEQALDGGAALVGEVARAGAGDAGRADARRARGPLLAVPGVPAAVGLVEHPDLLVPAAGQLDRPARAAGDRAVLADAAHDEDLNWQVSIVDLMKLLSMDSSLAARKALATELACPEETMAESADMNVWLHKAVLTKLAENGGNVPASLLD